MSNRISCGYVLLFFLIMGGSWNLLMSYRIYSESFKELERQKVAAEHYHWELCSIPEKVQKMRKWKECDENSRTMEITSEEGAIYSVLDSYKLCEMGFCGDFARSFADRLQVLFYLIIAFYILLCWIFGRWLFVKSKEENYLPHVNNNKKVE